MKKFFSSLSLNNKLAAAAILLGVISIFAGNPYGGTSITLNEKDIALSTVGSADKISVTELADWIIKDKADFELVDLRSAEKFNEYSIPNAQCIPLVQLSSSGLRRNHKIIFYSDNDVTTSQAWFLFKSKKYRGVYILDGGLDAWKEKVLFPKAPTNASKEELAQFEKVKEVANYFGGQVQTDTFFTETKQQIKLPAPTTSTTKTIAPTGKKKKREGC